MHGDLIHACKHQLHCIRESDGKEMCTGLKGASAPLLIVLSVARSAFRACLAHAARNICNKTVESLPPLKLKAKLETLQDVEPIRLPF